MAKNFLRSRKETNQLIRASSLDRVKLIIKSMVVILLLNYLFFKSIWAFPVLLPVGWWYYRLEKKNLMTVKTQEIREQFKELLLLAAAGQKAGNSIENAFLSGYGDMASLYGTNSSICKILIQLKSGKDNRIAFSEIWKQIGMQTNIIEILEFAQIYEIVNQGSGNMAAVMEKTAAIIVQKMDTQKEVFMMLSARKLEQKIMNMMPFVIMLYVSFTSPGYFDEMYHSIRGWMVMSVCLIFYLGAYAVSVKMISVSI